MFVDLLSAQSLMSVLLLFARVVGVCSFLPVPGLKQAGPVGILVLACAGTALLSGGAKSEPLESTASMGAIVGAILSEASLGLLIGLCVNLCVEAFVLAAQLLGLQAGFTYASTVNPMADADANVVQIVLQLYAMLLFVSVGLDRLTVKALAISVERLPPGGWYLERAHMEEVIRLISEVWVTALRLALPLIGLLLILDLTLAVFGRVCSQLQLLTTTFPVKTLATLGALALMIPTFELVAQAHAQKMMEFCFAVLSGPHR